MAAGLLILIDGGDLFISNWGTATIALTHLFTLGWLAMVMMGSFYQMVPVLVGGTVPFINVSRIVHALFTAGVLFFASGLYLPSPWLTAAAMVLLAAAFILFILQIAVSILKVEADRPTVVAMRVSVAALVVTVILGVYFSGAHAELWEFPENREVLTVTHLSMGLFGWVGGLIMGVGFHVIPMFYMTPQFPTDRAYLILGLHAFTLILLPVALLSGFGWVWTVPLWIPGFAAALLFAWTIFSLAGARKRKIVDAALRSWKAGLVMLPLALLALLAYQVTGDDRFVFFFGLLFILGFALTITVGMLYKIVPFLVWFHRFSLLIGKVRVPLLKDISPEKSAARQVIVLIAAVVSLLAGTAAQHDFVIRLGGGLFALSSLMLMIGLVKMVRMKAPEVPEERAGS